MPAKPRLAIVLGSGLGEIADCWPVVSTIPYRDVPGLAQSTVAGHAGRALAVEIGSDPVLVLQGRVHFYETGSYAGIVHLIRSVCACGIESILLTNAAGSINPTYRPGDLMILRDHISIPSLAGANVLTGPNVGPGPRFLPTADCYDPQLYVWAGEAGGQSDATVHSGVYCHVSGPTYETPSEVAALRLLGVDAVGMSTVPEALVARHCGVRVMGLSAITNVAGRHPAADEHAAVVAAAQRSAAAVSGILDSVARRFLSVDSV